MVSWVHSLSTPPCDFSGNLSRLSSSLVSTCFFSQAALKSKGKNILIWGRFKRFSKFSFPFGFSNHNNFHSKYFLVFLFSFFFFFFFLYKWKKFVSYFRTNWKLSLLFVTLLFLKSLIFNSSFFLFSFIHFLFFIIYKYMYVCMYVGKSFVFDICGVFYKHFSQAKGKRREKIDVTVIIYHI